MSARSVVLWDVGGTLVDYAMTPERYLRRYVESANVPFESLDPNRIKEAWTVRNRIWPSWRCMSDERAGYLEVTTILLRGSGASEEQVRALAAQGDRYFEMYTLFPGIRRLLNDLEDKGVTQGVVSNWPPSLRQFIDYLGLNHLFKSVVSSGEVGIAKPNPAIFHYALEELGVSATDCVFVGDNPDNDIRPSTELGMQAVHFDPRTKHVSADARDVEDLRKRLRLLL